MNFTKKNWEKELDGLKEMGMSEINISAIQITLAKLFSTEKISNIVTVDEDKFFEEVGRHLTIDGKEFFFYGVDGVIYISSISS